MVGWRWAYLIVLSVPGWASGDFRFHALNTGYGDCFLLQVGSPPVWNALVDAGTEEASPRISAYLRKQGIKTLSIFYLTHPHRNHFGALNRLRKRFSIGQIGWAGTNYHSLEADPILAQMRRWHLPTTTLRRGDILTPIEGLRIEILNPETLSSSEHDNLVLWITYGKSSLLLAGDLAITQQPVVAEWAAKNIAPSTVSLLAVWPHHGDRMHEAWAAWMNSATNLIVSTGPNPYNFPHVDQYPALQPKVIRTDLQGDILFQSNGVKWEMARP